MGIYLSIKYTIKIVNMLVQNIQFFVTGIYKNGWNNFTFIDNNWLMLRCCKEKHFNKSLIYNAKDAERFLTLNLN